MCPDPDRVPCKPRHRWQWTVSDVREGGREIGSLSFGTDNLPEDHKPGPGGPGLVTVGPRVCVLPSLNLRDSVGTGESLDRDSIHMG